MTSIDTGTHVSASVSGGAALSASLATAALDVDIGTVMYRDRNPYEGAYEATPTRETQTFSTAGFSMLHDFTVNPIPSNYGLITYNGSTITVS